MYQNYSAEGAETGQTPAQAPHSTQESASITYFPSPSEIAFTGHSLSQAPQQMQSSEIIYAIKRHLHNFSGTIIPLKLYFIIISEKIKCFLKIVIGELLVPLFAYKVNLELLNYFLKLRSCIRHSEVLK